MIATSTDDGFDAWCFDRTLLMDNIFDLYANPHEFAIGDALDRIGREAEFQGRDEIREVASDAIVRLEAKIAARLPRGIRRGDPLVRKILKAAAA